MSLALAATACGHGEDVAPPKVAGIQTRHAQFVYAMKSPARLELIAKLRQRNGADWTVNQEALLRSNMVVDPYAGFVRRAWSEKTHPPAAAPVTEDTAVLAARAFVRKNADLLGVPQSLTLALLDTTRAVDSDDHASARATYAVKLETEFYPRGYELFGELVNRIAVEVFVDDDGSVSSFVNLSQIHPHLFIDTKPGIPQNDERLFAKVEGRRVFALAGDHLRRIELGSIQHDDFVGAKLRMEIEPGPLNAWLTYRLTWLVSASRRAPESEEGAGFYFFFYLVDTDTGDVVLDSPVPTELANEGDIP